MAEGGGPRAASIGVPESSSQRKRSWSETTTSNLRFRGGASPMLRWRAATPPLMWRCFVFTRAGFPERQPPRAHCALGRGAWGGGGREGGPHPARVVVRLRGGGL